MNKEQKVIEAAINLLSSMNIGEPWEHDKNMLAEAIKELDAPELITMDGEYTYRNGEPATVVSTNRPLDDFPVLSYHSIKGGLETHRPNGMCTLTDEPHNFDLIPVKKEPREWWINPSCSEYPVDRLVTPPFKNAIKVREVLEDEI